MAAETGLWNILCAGLLSFRSCLSRSDFRESVLLRFIEPTKVDPPRMSIVGIDTELLFGVIKREIDIFQIGSPLSVFMTTFEVSICDPDRGRLCVSNVVLRSAGQRISWIRLAGCYPQKMGSARSSRVAEQVLDLGAGV